MSSEPLSSACSPLWMSDNVSQEELIESLIPQASSSHQIKNLTAQTFYSGILLSYWLYFLYTITLYGKVFIAVFSSIMQQWWFVRSTSILKLFNYFFNGTITLFLFLLEDWSWYFALKFFQNNLSIAWEGSWGSTGTR